MPIFQSFESKLKNLERNVKQLDRKIPIAQAQNKAHVHRGKGNPNWMKMAPHDPIAVFRNRAQALDARRVQLATPGSSRFSHKHTPKNHARLYAVKQRLNKSKSDMNVWNALRRTWLSPST